MEPAGDSIVLEEEIDPNYEPTEREVQEYASWLGMDLDAEQDLFWIAREGLKAPLPENWKPCKTTDTEEIYYFNFSTGQSTWDHPCDEYYRKVYEDHKKKRSTSSRGATDGDERKKKEKQDVAELLGKKGGKKKKAAAPLGKPTDPLGPPVLARGGAVLGEKKPLPGLGGGKLNRLSSGGLGSASSLKPVASLGRLKGEAKDDGDGVALDEDADEEEEVERKPSPRALSKPPLGSLLSKKPLPSAAPLSKADSKAELDGLACDFDQKKQKLAEAHARIYRELEDEHEATLAAQKKKSQQELDELTEQEGSKLKQRRRELDKKLHDIENQFDKDESNLLRERKEKLKRLESDMELTLSQKRQELDRGQQKEIQRLQSRHDAQLQELKVDLERQEKQLKTKSDGLHAAAELAQANDKLTSDLQRREEQAAEDTRQREALRQAQAEAEEQVVAANKRIEELQQQLVDASDEVARLSRPADTPAAHAPAAECSGCASTVKRVNELELQLANERRQAIATRETVTELQQQLEDAAAHAAATVVPSGSSASDAELAALRQAETALRRDVETVNASHQAVVAELAEWKTKCATLQAQHKAQEATAAAQLNEAAGSAARTPACGHEDELEALRGELAELQDQVTTMAKTNAQIKDQLLKESNEKKQLREQLDNALADDSSRELSRKLEQQQREVDELSKRAQAETIAKDEQLQDLSEQLHRERQATDQMKRRLEEEHARLEGENRKLVSESALLNRQMDERLIEASQAGDAAEQQANATVTKQKWEIEQLQASLKLATRDHEELATRVQRLQDEVDAAMQAKHQLAMEKDAETARFKKKDAERDALEGKLTVVQAELDAQVEKTRAASSDIAELKTQLSKLKFKEQASLDKLAHAEDELRQAESKLQAQQSESERLARELRGKASLLDEKTSAWRDRQAESEVLSEQLSDAMRQLSELRARGSGGGGGGPSHSAAAGGGGSGEVAALRLRVSELDATVDALTQEKMQLQDKQRVLTQKQLAAEASLRTSEAERERLADEYQSETQEATKWKERLEKKTKEVEQLKAELFSANNEKELVELALNKERDERRDVATQKMLLEKTKKQLDATVESLTTQLHELEAGQARSAMETQTHQSKVKRLETEMESVARELRATQDERDALNAKLKQQSAEMAALETRVRLLRSENNEQNARAKAFEDDAARHGDALKRLETQLDEKEARLRRESDEKDALAKQIAALRTEKDELESELLATKRKTESVEARYKDHESAASRGDFQLKLRVQQLEAERDGVATGKDRAEQHAKGMEKELLHVKEELGTAKHELDAARARIKVLTLEKDEFQTALLQAQSSQATAASLSRPTGFGASSDAMLVRLQLADVTKAELETHLADVATQLELATRRCTLAEARCRDQCVEMESLHVEIASLRSSMAKMHASALETLPLVERLEYEHRKRTLKRDLNAQLRGFQEREEHALMRQKARARAQHEKLLEELEDELEARRQCRVEHEEAVGVQLLEQLRKERDAKAKELRSQLETELLEEERVLAERKERRLAGVAAALRQDEELTRARQREDRQAQREEELLAAASGGSGGGHAGIAKTMDTGNESPGQVFGLASRGRSRNRRRSKRRDESNASDSASDDDDDDDGAQRRQAKKQLRGRSRGGKTGGGRRDAAAPRGRSCSRHRERAREIERWRQRLADETALLDKAKALVADQKKQLKRQADTIKKDKLAWKHEWAGVGRTGGHRVSILQEMKAMIDQSAASWNTNMLQLRERGEWIDRREAKLQKMRRALATLRGGRRRQSRTRRIKPTVRFDSEDRSGSASPSLSDDASENQARDVDSDAVLDKLARLDGELASDVSEFSSDDHLWAGGAVARDAPAYAPAYYSHSLSTSDPLLLGEPSARLFRSPRVGRAFSSSNMGGSSRARLTQQPQQRVWPVAGSSYASRVGAAAVQRRIARWAHGRETLQHAATKQASWLTGLYQEVKAYGDARAQTSVDAAPGERVLHDHDGS